MDKADMKELREAAECAQRWRDVADELPREAQEVLFVRGGKTVHGAWIGGIFWHNNQKMAAAYWMPLPKAPVQRGIEMTTDRGAGGNEMSAKQTPLVDLLRLHADDLHSDHGYNKSARLLSQAADEVDRLRAELAECRRDAERYRWLRGTVPESSSRWARWRLECWISGAWHELRGLHLDTCIDAARKGEGEE